MSKCIVCNKSIKKGGYFCEDCLKEEVGPLPNRLDHWRTIILSLSPFSASNYLLHWTADERLRWAVNVSDRITTTYPQLSETTVVDNVCRYANLNTELNQQSVLNALKEIRNNRRGPKWSPADVIFQPLFQAVLFSAVFVILLVFAARLY